MENSPPSFRWQSYSSSEWLNLHLGPDPAFFFAFSATSLLELSTYLMKTSMSSLITRSFPLGYRQSKKMEATTKRNPVTPQKLAPQSLSFCSLSPRNWNHYLYSCLHHFISRFLFGREMRSFSREISLLQRRFHPYDPTGAILIK